jgi:2'-5' RNA ligase
MSILKEIILKKFLAEGKTIKRHDYSYTFVRVNGPYKNHINELQRLINRKHFHGQGLEKDHHATVLYGIKTNSTNDIRKLFFDLKMKSFWIDVVDVEVFKNESDTVVLKCKSKELLELRSKVEKLPHKKTFKDYRPHITLAYLKPGYGDLYKSYLKKKFVKGKFKVNFLYFSDQFDNEMRYRLLDPVSTKTPATGKAS